jgi:hypothetical protein
MIACISPSDFYIEENLSTLTYANKTSYISNEPVKNVDPKTKLINDLRDEVADLKSELTKARKNLDIVKVLPIENGGTSTQMSESAVTTVSTPVSAQMEMETHFKEMNEILATRPPIPVSKQRG